MHLWIAVSFSWETFLRWKITGLERSRSATLENDLAFCLTPPELEALPIWSWPLDSKILIKHLTDCGFSNTLIYQKGAVFFFGGKLKHTSTYNVTLLYLILDTVWKPYCGKLIRDMLRNTQGKYYINLFTQGNIWGEIYYQSIFRSLESIKS